MLIQLFYHCFDLRLFFGDILTDQSEKAHVDIGHPNQGKPSNEVAPPIIHQQAKICKDDKKDGYIMAETIFTGK